MRTENRSRDAKNIGEEIIKHVVLKQDKCIMWNIHIHTLWIVNLVVSGI